MRRYSENQYGVTASPLHGGLPTDRCIAEWWIDSPRVQAVLAGEPADAAARSSGSPYPADIARSAPRTATARARFSSANGEKFLEAFARGLAVTGFERSEGARDLSPGALRMKLDTSRRCGRSGCRWSTSSRPASRRTYKRDIILVEVAGRGTLGVGRGHRRRESVLQRGVDRLRVADPARLRRAARARARDCKARRTWRR